MFKEWDDIITCTPLRDGNKELPAGIHGHILEVRWDILMVELYVGEIEDRKFYFCCCYPNEVQHLCDNHA